MIIVYSMLGALIGTIIAELGIVVAVRLIQMKRTTKK